MTEEQIRNKFELNNNMGWVGAFESRMQRCKM